MDDPSLWTTQYILTGVEEKVSLSDVKENDKTRVGKAGCSWLIICRIFVGLASKDHQGWLNAWTNC